MMTKIPEVLKSGSGKRWVWITGVVAIFALLFAIAWNIECERAVAPQELPGEARSFIAQHYPEENPGRNRAYLPGMGSEVEQYDRIDLR